MYFYGASHVSPTIYCLLCQTNVHKQNRKLNASLIILTFLFFFAKLIILTFRCLFNNYFKYDCSDWSLYTNFCCSRVFWSFIKLRCKIFIQTLICFASTRFSFYIIECKYQIGPINNIWCAFAFKCCIRTYVRTNNLFGRTWEQTISKWI